MDCYWSYYDDKFSWDHSHELVQPNLDLTRRRFSDIGLSDDEAQTFIASGYVMVMGDVVIDRFYGGALLSADLHTRIPVDHFKRWYEEKSLRPRPVVVTAKSMTEVRTQVDTWRRLTNRELLFRGQTAHFELQRARPNPDLVVAGLGEISLLPSVWRTMKKLKPDSFLNFYGPMLIEWHKIISAQCDVAEVNRRVAKINDEGGWIHSYQDMEDCDDPLLQNYGRLNLDLSYGMNFNLADLLNTLLQHYGLLSPYLDLTRDLDVAMFFATHKFQWDATTCRYEFVGSNGRQSILYVLREDRREMHGHEDERIVTDINPLRPLRQSCVICRSSPYALNLPADFIFGVIKLDFDLAAPIGHTVEHLFPSREEDKFLAALKKAALQPDRVTDFSIAKPDSAVPQ